MDQFNQNVNIRDFLLQENMTFLVFLVRFQKNSVLIEASVDLTVSQKPLTAISKSNRTFAILWSKMAFF